jgi:hypothetical protein
MEAVAVAISLSGSMGQTTGVSVSGGGAGATNIILGGTRAFVTGSTLTAGGNVSLSASDTSAITARVAAVSGSVTYGGTTGVAVAIGISVAENYLGWSSLGVEEPLEILAYVSNSTLNSGGSLNLSALSNMTIYAGVGAGAVAIAGGGTTGVAPSVGLTVSLNQVSTKVQAYLDHSNITVSNLTLLSEDTSHIDADTASVAVSASFAGTASVGVSVGAAAAENVIHSVVEAFIANGSNVTVERRALQFQAEGQAPAITLPVKPMLLLTAVRLRLRLWVF